MLTVAELAKRIGAELYGDSSINIKAVGPIEAASKDDITFVANDKYLPMLEKTKAPAVILRKRVEHLSKSQLIVKNVNAALIETLKLLAVEAKPPKPGIDKTAVIGENTEIADDASIGPCVVIADGVKVGAKSAISAGCKIGANSIIGKNTRLDFNVAVYHNCKIGNNVIIQANTTIGSTGFGYVFLDGAHKLIPHNGGVIIEDFVEIGANCCIDRAKFGNTTIGAGTKVDNLVQIAHNVVISKCCLIIGQAGIAGSSKLGDGVVLASQAGIIDNVSIGDGVIIGAQSGVAHDVPAGQKMLGSPAIDYSEEIRRITLVKKLPKMAQRLKELTKRIDKLEAAKDDKK
ncbi:MAG: UDP-3-O-(3-hydroxymyristoyl)glucosamine N-acyltransferase [Sedimentisphaerales bacterium]|nr:UDP-3-O-(3-hydroxymyristoyl)glucosamine N-acyltransferase [Sedimentisphaerales bacterium]